MAEDKPAWTPPPAGTPCWIEIPAVNVEASQKFYSSIFPAWEFRPATVQYPSSEIAMFMYGGKTGLGGGIKRVEAAAKATSHPDNAGSTIFHLVESIEATKKKIVEVGGKTTSEKIPEGEHGFYMYCKDIEGNRFGIYEFTQGKST